MLILALIGIFGTLLAIATQVPANQGASNLGSWAKLLGLTSLAPQLRYPGANQWALYTGCVLLLTAGSLGFWRWNARSKVCPQIPLCLAEAVTRHCDPEFVAVRDRYLSTYHETLARYHEIEVDMKKTAEGGWSGRPEALQKYNELRETWEHLGAVLTAAVKGLQDVGAVLHDELSKRLVSGALVARGFAEPHNAGNDEVDIKPPEWRILDPQPETNAATKKGDPSSVIYSGIEVVPASDGERPDASSPSPMEIVFDPTNPLRRFWSIEQGRDDVGQPVPGHSYWEYRVLIRNRSSKTLRNVRVTVEAIGPMPTRPEPSQFDIDKSRSLDLNPHEEVFALLRRWYNPPIVVGMICGGAYGPIKVIASADDVFPTTKFFHFAPEKTPMISEIIW